MEIDDAKEHGNMENGDAKEDGNMETGDAKEDGKMETKELSDKDKALNKEIEQAREEMVQFCAQKLGVTGVHLAKDPADWPEPYGDSIHKPSMNCLREDYLDVETPEQMLTRYMAIINRTMIHECREGYCLEKEDNSQEKKCRFHFPQPLLGFEAIHERKPGAKPLPKWPFPVKPGGRKEALLLGVPEVATNKCTDRKLVKMEKLPKYPEGHDCWDQGRAV